MGVHGERIPRCTPQCREGLCDRLPVAAHAADHTPSSTDAMPGTRASGASVSWAGLAEHISPCGAIAGVPVDRTGRTSKRERSKPRDAGNVAHQTTTGTACPLGNIVFARPLQLDGASASGAEGHRFESCRARHPPNPLLPRKPASFGRVSRFRDCTCVRPHLVRNGQKPPQNVPSEHQKLAVKLARRPRCTGRSSR